MTKVFHCGQPVFKINLWGVIQMVYTFISNEQYNITRNITKHLWCCNISIGHATLVICRLNSSKICVPRKTTWSVSCSSWGSPLWSWGPQSASRSLHCPPNCSPAPLLPPGPSARTATHSTPWTSRGCWFELSPWSSVIHLRVWVWCLWRPIGLLKRWNIEM